MYIELININESYFETGDLCWQSAHRILQQPGEANLPQNLNPKFIQGAAVMFWGAILYGKSGKFIPFI